MAGHIVSITGHIVSTAGRIASITGHIVFTDGNIASTARHIVSTAGHIVSTAEHIVSIAGHIVITVRKQRDIFIGAPFSFSLFFSPRCQPTSWWVFLPQQA